MTATFWTVAAVIAGLWLVSFAWHLFMRDWLPPAATVPATAAWHSFLDRIRRAKRGGTHGTNPPCSEVGDA